MNQQLFQRLQIANTIAEDFSDGAWQCYLQDLVTEFNRENNTDYDPFETWLEFCHKLSEPKDNKIPFNVGNMVVAGKDFSNVKAGMIGVVYEVYDRSGFDDNGGEGVSIIFESGFYDGFSEQEITTFSLEPLGRRVYVLRDYQFKDVITLSDDFKRGLFEPAFVLGKREVADHERAGF